MAGNEQSAVRQALDFVAQWRGEKAFPGSVQYGLEFDLSSLEDSVTNLLSLQTAGLPPTAQAELKKRALKKALPNLDSKTAALIDQEMARMTMAVGQDPGTMPIGE